MAGQRLHAAAALAAALCLATASATSYYISSSNPASSDASAGTDPEQPWRTLQRASAQALQPGDSIRLLSGDVWTLHGSDSWTFTGLRGTPASPITIGAYADSSAPPPVRPLILKAPMGANATVVFDNCTGITITDVEVAGGEVGIAFLHDVVNGSPTVYSGFNITDVQIRDVHGLNPDPSTSTWWGVAVAFAARHAGVTVTNVTLDRVVVSDSDTFYINELHSPAGAWTRPFVTGLTVSRCSLTRMSFNTLFLDTTNHVSITGNVFYNNTPASLFVAGTTDIILGSTDATVVIAGNEIGWRGEYQPGGPDGCAIDFETAANGTVVRDMYIHHSFGAGIMVFGHQTTSTNLVFDGNVMLSNGCGQTRGDQGGIAFMHANQSGVISNSVFTPCPNNTPPIFNPLKPGNEAGWTIANNVVDGVNGTVVVMPAPSIGWSAFNGTFVITASCPACPAGSVLVYSTAGLPTAGGQDTTPWPLNSTGNGYEPLVLPPKGVGLWAKVLPPGAALAAAEARTAGGSSRVTAEAATARSIVHHHTAGLGSSAASASAATAPSSAAPATTTYVEGPSVGDVLAWPRG